MPSEDSADDDQGLAGLKARDRQWDRWLAYAAVSVSGISAASYFVFSDAIRGYAAFLFGAVGKVFRALG